MKVPILKKSGLGGHGKGIVYASVNFVGLRGSDFYVR